MAQSGHTAGRGTKPALHVHVVKLDGTPAGGTVLRDLEVRVEPFWAKVEDKAVQNLVKLIQSLVTPPGSGPGGGGGDIGDIGGGPDAVHPVWQPGKLLPPAVLDAVLTSPVYIQRLKLSSVYATVTVHASLKV